MQYVYTCTLFSKYDKCVYIYIYKHDAYMYLLLGRTLYYCQFIFIHVSEDHPKTLGYVAHFATKYACTCLLRVFVYSLTSLGSFLQRPFRPRSFASPRSAARALALLYKVLQYISTIAPAPVCQLPVTAHAWHTQLPCSGNNADAYGVKNDIAPYIWCNASKTQKVSPVSMVPSHPRSSQSVTAPHCSRDVRLHAEACPSLTHV